MNRILVVDDEIRIRKLYASLLESEGFNVVEAPNVDIANELIKRIKIDLVLLDINMPGVDGSVLKDVIRLFHKKMKIIVSSVYSIDEQMRIINEAVDYYDKAQGTEVLLYKIKSALEKTDIN